MAAEKSPTFKTPAVQAKAQAQEHLFHRGEEPLFVRRILLSTPSVFVSTLMTLIDFTLSNARRFYSSMGNPSDTEGLRKPHLKGC